VDTLKLAKPFVDGLLLGVEEAALTNAILRIADLLDLQVIAEGIEQEAVARELERLGCRFGQGFHFARPLDQFAVEALLLAEQGRRASPPPGPGPAPEGPRPGSGDATAAAVAASRPPPPLAGWRRAGRR
jgi:predicted signal transduction protein with EAL and GGDEF domain